MKKVKADLDKATKRLTEGEKKQKETQENVKKAKADHATAAQAAENTKKTLKDKKMEAGDFSAATVNLPKIPTTTPSPSSV